MTPEALKRLEARKQKAAMAKRINKAKGVLERIRVTAANIERVEHFLSELLCAPCAPRELAINPTHTKHERGVSHPARNL